MKKTALWPVFAIVILSLLALGDTANATALVDQTAQPPPALTAHAVLQPNVVAFLQATQGYLMDSRATTGVMLNANATVSTSTFSNAPAAYPLPMTFGEVTLLSFGDPTLFEAGRADTLEVNLISATIADMPPKEFRATMSSGVAKGMIGTRPMELTLAMSRGPTG